MEMFLIMLLIAGGCLFVYWLQNRGPALTGPATVVSRRTEVGKMPGNHWRGYGSSWNYLVTFHLADGEEIELYTFENIYNTLTEGQSGQLTWHQDTLSSFTPNKED